LDRSDVVDFYNGWKGSSLRLMVEAIGASKRLQVLSSLFKRKANLLIKKKKKNKKRKRKANL
jgi:hypothetical protein